MGVGLRVIEPMRAAQGFRRLGGTALAMQGVSQIGMSRCESRIGGDGGSVARFRRLMVALAEQGVSKAFLLPRLRL